MNAVLARLPITPILLVVAILELGVRRIASHLIGGHTPLERGLLHHVVEIGGLFTFYLTGILALGIFSWAAIILIRDRSLFHIPDRMLFTFFAALFLPLATVGLFLNLPPAMAPHLNTSFGLLVIALTFGLLRSPVTLRAKLGVIYLAAPLLFHCFWLMTQQIPAWAPSGDLSELPSQIYEIGEHLLVVGAIASFLFFAPFPRLSNLLSPFPVAVASSVTITMALLVKFRYPATQLAAYHGLSLTLPPPSLQVGMYLVALFFFVLTLCLLVIRSANDRATAIGLSFIAISGYHLELPYQLLLTLIGVMQLVRSAINEGLGADDDAPQGMSPSLEAWKTYLQRLAEACCQRASETETIVLQHKGQLIAHLRGKRGEIPLSLRIVHERHEIQRIEINFGEVPTTPAAISLQRRRKIRGKKVSQAKEGPPVALQVEAFDTQFSLHDSSGQAPELLQDPALQMSLFHLHHGWLGIWPDEGLRYLACPDSTGWPVPLAELTFSPEVAATEELEALIALLTTLSRGMKVP